MLQSHVLPDRPVPLQTVSVKKTVVEEPGRYHQRPEPSGWLACLATPCHLLISQSWFENGILVSIILNTCFLASEHYRTVCRVPGGAAPGTACVDQAAEMGERFATSLQVFEGFFLVIFVLEMITKNIGLGLRRYWADPYDAFDGIIVIGGIIDYFQSGDGGSSGIGVLRVVRLTRVARSVKLVRKWTALRKIIETLVTTLPSLGYMSILLLLFMFIAAVAGMQLFGDVIPMVERSNYSNFGLAMLTTFQILTGENWNAVMYSAINHWEGTYWVSPRPSPLAPRPAEGALNAARPFARISSRHQSILSWLPAWVHSAS